MKRNQKGFTLLELMIVVAIVSILLAIVIPNAIRYRESSSGTGYIAIQQHLTDAMIAAQQEFATGFWPSSIEDLYRKRLKQNKNIILRMLPIGGSLSSITVRIEGHYKGDNEIYVIKADGSIVKNP